MNARRAYPAWIELAVVLLVMTLVFHRSYVSIVQTWMESSTFVHGFAILPICLFLIWRKWPRLATVKPVHAAPGIAALALLSLLWWVSDLIGLQVGMQFAVTAMIPAAVIAVMGVEFALTIAFPLAYLFFAVPFGEALIPRLMDFTATFTVEALNVTGIPVVRDGRFFSIPTGNFEVARACSGIRYLLASVAFGTLYGYLSYSSTRKRAIFFAVAVLLPVVANGLRAYGIVLLAYYSDMQLAVGIDHILFGWVFFGVIIFLMILVGDRFRDKMPLRDSPDSKGVSAGGWRVDAGPGRSLFVVLACVCAAAGPLTAKLGGTAAATATTRVPAVPTRSAGWAGRAVEPGDWRPRFSGERAETFARYERNGQWVDVAVISYARIDQEQELVHWDHQVVDQEYWQMRSVNEAGPTAMTEILAQRADGTARIVWYWFDVNGHRTSSKAKVKLLEAWYRIRGKAVTSSLVALGTESFLNREQGRQLLREFSNSAASDIQNCLSRPQAGDGCELTGQIVMEERS